jgi:hypothetical protein
MLLLLGVSLELIEDIKHLVIVSSNINGYDSLCNLPWDYNDIDLVQYIVRRLFNGLASE